MKVQYTKRFSKDLDSILHDEKLKKRLLRVIETMKRIDSLDGMDGVRKIQGYDGFYRIRMGDWRLGIKVEGDCVHMMRFLHRKDIYRKFP